MKKRILSLLLALMMVLSLIPTLAFAAGEDNSKVTVYFSLSDNGKYKSRPAFQKFFSLFVVPFMFPPPGPCCKECGPGGGNRGREI